MSSNFKYCLLPDDKLAVANFDNEKLFVFDLHNQKLIVQHIKSHLYIQLKLITALLMLEKNCDIMKKVYICYLNFQQL